MFIFYIWFSILYCSQPQYFLHHIVSHHNSSIIATLIQNPSSLLMASSNSINVFDMSSNKSASKQMLSLKKIFMSGESLAVLRGKNCEIYEYRNGIGNLISFISSAEKITVCRGTNSGQHLIIGKQNGQIIDKYQNEDYRIKDAIQTINGIGLTKNEKTMITGGNDKNLRIYEWNGQFSLQFTINFGKTINFVHIANDKMHVIASSYDGEIKVYKKMAQFYSQYQKLVLKYEIKNIAISEDSQMIVVGGKTNFVEIFKVNPKSGKFVFYQTLNHTLSEILSMDIGQNKSIIILTSNNETNVYKECLYELCCQNYLKCVQCNFNLLQIQKYCYSKGKQNKFRILLSNTNLDTTRTTTNTDISTADTSKTTNTTTDTSKTTNTTTTDTSKTTNITTDTTRTTNTTTDTKTTDTTTDPSKTTNTTTDTSRTTTDTSNTTNTTTDTSRTTTDTKTTDTTTDPSKVTNTTTDTSKTTNTTTDTSRTTTDTSNTTNKTTDTSLTTNKTNNLSQTTNKTSSANTTSRTNTSSNTTNSTQISNETKNFSNSINTTGENNSTSNTSDSNITEKMSNNSNLANINQTNLTNISLNSSNLANMTNSTNKTLNSENTTNTTLNSSNTTANTSENNSTQKNQSTNKSQNMPQNCLKMVGDICVQYCPKQCSTCNAEKQCLTCAQFYSINENNQCFFESTALQFANKANNLLSNIRLRKLKLLFFLVDNFWLYEYHQANYTWLTSKLFATIRVLQSKKSEIIDSQQFPFIEQKIKPSFPNYYPYSNDKYTKIQGKDSFFFRSTIQYFIMVVPYTIIFFLLFQKLFYCLFNYEISKYLRIFSFWGFLFQMGLQSNIQFFTFLGFRNFHTMFSFNFANKVYLSLFIFVMFFVVIFAFGGYYLLYYFYGRLSKYFLDNLYRVKGSFFMMSFIYGIRPFLKGVIHYQLYDYNKVQLSLLAGIEFLTCIILVMTQLYNKIFIFRSVFFCDFAIYSSLTFFNIILLYTRFLDQPTLKENMEEIDFYLEIISIFLTVTLGLRMVLNFVLCKSLVQHNPIEQIQKQTKKKIIFKGDDFDQMKAEKEEEKKNKELSERKEKKGKKPKKDREEKLKKYEEQRLKMKKSKNNQQKKTETESKQESEI